VPPPDKDNCATYQGDEPVPVLTSAPNSSLFKRHTSRSCALITALVVPLIGALWIWGGDVSAQGLAPTRPGGSTLPKPRETTPEGPAEAAPEAEYEDVEPELPPLPPWPGQQRKKLQFFEIGGDHNLGQRDLEINKGGQIRTIRAPFWRPLSENSNSNVSCAARRTQPVVGTGANRDINADDCPKRTLSGANMRLRLEPTINVAETVRVHSQVDIFDNLVLGSTPDSLSAGGRPASVPLDFLSESQAPPVAGQNSSTSAIVVFPAPVSPTSAIRRPSSSRRLTPRNTSST